MSAKKEMRNKILQTAGSKYSIPIPKLFISICVVSLWLSLTNAQQQQQQQELRIKRNQFLHIFSENESANKMSLHWNTRLSFEKERITCRPTSKYEILKKFKVSVCFHTYLIYWPFLIWTAYSVLHSQLGLSNLNAFDTHAESDARNVLGTVLHYLSLFLVNVCVCDITKAFPYNVSVYFTWAFVVVVVVHRNT